MFFFRAAPKKYGKVFSFKQTNMSGNFSFQIEELFQLFSEAFKHLPLCTVVNDSVFVVHGGLSSKDVLYTLMTSKNWLSEENSISLIRVGTYG